MEETTAEKRQKDLIAVQILKYLEKSSVTN